MALYSGETIFITHTAKIKDRVLTDDDVDQVTITIYDAENEEVLPEATMVWNDEESQWEYLWDTSPNDTPLPAGSYRAKVYVLGNSGEENWEFKRIRLKANPV